jgi:RimJ/RimL family protein N-acetyltransferase
MKVYLETERLLLREFTEADADDLFALDNDPAVMRFLNGGAPADRAAIRERLLPNFRAYYQRSDGYGYWAAIEKASGAFLGWFHFRPARTEPEAIELGYRLNRAAWGKGYATEGARALIRKGFVELGTRRVVATTLAGNAASIRVMEKAGLTFARRFVYEGEPAWHIGQEAVEYALNRDEWLPD